MTTEKKEFLIPENVEEGVKLLGDVKVKELIKTLAPSALLSAAVFYTPIHPFIKLGIAAVLIGVPCYLIMDRPTRRNIPVLYILKAYVRYVFRQKFFPYGKEKYHVQSVIEETDEGRKTEANSTKENTVKGRTWWAFNNSR